MERKKSKPIQYLHLLLFDHIASDPSSSMMLHPHLGGLKGLDKARAVEEKLQKYLKDLQRQEKNCISSGPLTNSRKKADFTNLYEGEESVIVQKQCIGTLERFQSTK